MLPKQHYIIINFVTALAVTLFFACDSNNIQEQAPFNFENAPDAVGKEIQLKYTDSGKLKAVLRTPTILDYSSGQMKYREFPDGLVLDVFDKEMKKTVVTSKYGVSYESTGIIDLRGDVDVKTGDSVHLEAPQLYWDQGNGWMFTDKPYKATFSNGSFNDGLGFDANQDFSNFNSRTNVGVQFIEE